MSNEEELSEQQSLELITSTINKAKCDYEETGVGALIWGGLVAVCSLVTFGNFYWQIPALNFIWMLTLIAAFVQVSISVRAAKKKKYKTYNDDAMAAIWISFGIALFLASVYSTKYQLPNAAVLFLIMYGIPTFATGYIYRFTPFIIGSIVFWLAGIASMYIEYPFIMLLTAASSIIAWVVPGLILRRRYINAKQHNV